MLRRKVDDPYEPIHVGLYVVAGVVVQTEHPTNVNE